MRQAVQPVCRNLACSLALAAALAAPPGLAAEPLPPHPPVPAAKPPADANAPLENPGQSGPPVPERRPAPPTGRTPPPPEASAGSGPPGSGKVPEEATEGGAGKPEPVPVPGVAENGDALAACYRQLDALGVTYAKKGTVNDAGSCGMEAPVAVAGVLPGVTLEPDAEMRCATALALAEWTKRVVEPAAEELGTNVRLTGLSQGSAYVCRHRDGDPDRTISQHAFGNAVDVVTFHFAGHPALSIAPRQRTGTIEEGFQRAVIGGACLYFTTVLGPRSDAFHQDNLHLDIDRRSHGFRLCQ